MVFSVSIRKFFFGWKIGSFWGKYKKFSVWVENQIEDQFFQAHAKKFFGGKCNKFFPWVEKKIRDNFFKKIFYENYF